MLASDLLNSLYCIMYVQALDAEGAAAAFKVLAADIDREMMSSSGGVMGTSGSLSGTPPTEGHVPPSKKTPEEVAHGFLRVAIEAMCRPIRNLTTMKVKVVAALL